ncbi:MAG: hypothetical protein RL653_877 [Pseudomonadota bacterium]
MSIVVLLLGPLLLAGSTPRGDGAARGREQATAEAWLRLLSDEECAAQMVVGTTVRPLAGQPAPGGVLLFGAVLRSPSQLDGLLSSLRARSRVPPLVAVDMEGGRVNRLSHLPGLRAMPSGQVLGRLPPAEVEAWGRRVGAAMAGLGLNCNLAPVLDLAGSGLMHATARSLGTEPLEVAERSAAFSRGLWAEGVIPIGKHFPGYGEVARNTDYQRVVVDRSAAEFNRHLRPFAHAGEALGGVMLANLGFSFYGGQPAIFSEALVSLAHEQGFVTMTDDLAAPPLRGFVGGRQREVARAAFRAGNDLLLVSGSAEVLDELSEVLREELARPGGRALAREAAGRILRLKVRAGLLPGLPVDAVQRAAGSVGVERPCRQPPPP